MTQAFVLLGILFVALSAIGESARPASDWFWWAGFVLIVTGITCEGTL